MCLSVLVVAVCITFPIAASTYLTRSNFRQERFVLVDSMRREAGVGVKGG